MSKFTFENKYDDAYLGSEGFLCGADPFIAYLPKSGYAVIIDGKGVTVDITDNESNYSDAIFLESKLKLNFNKALEGVAYFETLSEKKFLALITATYEKCEY